MNLWKWRASHEKNGVKLHVVAILFRKVKYIYFVERIISFSINMAVFYKTSIKKILWQNV